MWLTAMIIILTLLWECDLAKVFAFYFFGTWFVFLYLAAKDWVKADQKWKEETQKLILKNQKRKVSPRMRAINERVRKECQEILDRPAPQSQERTKEQDIEKQEQDQPGSDTPVDSTSVPESEITVPLIPVPQNPQNTSLKCYSSVQNRKRKRKLRQVKSKLKDKHVFTASEIKCLSNRSATSVVAVKKELKCFVKNIAKISDSPIPYNRN